MKSRFVRLVLSLLVLAIVGTPLAHAQATRTWVSGVGDDANPCSRTAPCKTFAGAISKTASGGEINVLDPGGFGAVTITKPITISSWSFEAGVLVSGTNGIVVSVPNATDTVILRGLDIEGLGTGLSGVTVLTGGNVTVENCTINKFTVSGINFATTVAGSQLHVADTVIRNNGNFGGATGQGVFMAPSASATGTFERVHFDHNVAGLKTQGSVNATVSNSVSANNAFAGYSAFSTGASLTLEHSVASHNGTGVVCNSGTTVRLGNMVLTDNGADLSTGGSCLSFKNNDAQTTISVTAIVPTPQ